MILLLYSINRYISCTILAHYYTILLYHKILCHYRTRKDNTHFSMTPYTKPLPEQKENTKHGEQLFPLQKYITKLYPEDTTVTAHWHEEAEFTKITKGACRYQIHLETYDVEKGDFIFIPPAVLHSIINDRLPEMESDTYVFHMNFLGVGASDVCAIQYLMPITNRKLIPPVVIRRTHPIYTQISSIYNEICKHDKEKQPGYELWLKSLLLSLLAVLIPYCKEESDSFALQNQHIEKLKEVLRYISDHYMDELSIEELASICCFSQSYFIHFFKKYVGMSCIEYINNVRLEQAALQLESNTDTTLDVSLAVGFRNLSYFHRAFKKKYGMTPGKFVQENNAGFR